MQADQLTTDEIFAEALRRSQGSERAKYLDEVYGHDVAARDRMERLLRAHADAQSFLEVPASDPLATEEHQRAIAERPGTIIGPYKLLQQIGEGGMGIVFMAEQSEPIQRTVALKIIKPGMDTRQVIARFEAERQAVAMMDHPNIAKVLDAGTTDSGRPYFVMELVKGVPITKYCDEKHLPLRARLELFVQVCQAVQHAHQKGIIHRDIKPNNVLVAEYDNRAVPKVIDFGVAKATAQRLTERTMFTEFGQVLGTMEYMSPEQSKFNQLDIDTRSDIYSLGVLLYELLAGSTPFEGKRLHEAAFDEMLRIIREEEPPKPSTRLSSIDTLPSVAANRHTEPARLSKDVRGELDWIVMKALEKDRNRRYETASGFAADIERHLHDEPVEAGPPSATYRFRKFARRNKGPVLATAVVLLTLVGGIVGTTFGLVRAEQARRAEADRAEGERQARQEAQAVLDFVENKVFAAARPEGQDGGLGHDVTLRKAVEAALPFVEASFTNKPLIEARLRMTLGDSFWYLGEAGIAADQYQKARALYTRHLGPDHPKTLRSMSDLANSYYDLERHNEALKLREETLMLQKAKLGPYHPSTLSSMVNLANSYATVGRRDEALKLHEETLALRKAKFGPDDPDTLNSMHNLAVSYFELGRWAEALKLREETLTLIKAKVGPDHPDTFWSMSSLANSYAAMGRHDEALKLNEETLMRRKAKLGPDHPDTLTSMNELGNSYENLGRHAEALKFREETLTLMKVKFGREGRQTLMSMHNLANSYETLGRHDEALKLREQTLMLEKAKLGPDDPETLNSMGNLARSYFHVGRKVEAVKLREETLMLMKAKLGPDHPDTLVSMGNLANSYAALGRHDEALKLREETLTLRKAKLGPDHPGTLLSMHNLAVSYSALGRKTEALELEEETLVLRKAKLGLDHADTLMTMHNLGTSYSDVGRHADALKLREETLVLTSAKLGPDHPDTIESMSLVAESLVKLDRGAQAVPIIDECLQRAAGKEVDPDLIPDVMDLRLRHFEKIRDAAGCLETADKWEALKRTDAESLYQSASFRAVCAAVIEETDKTPASEAKVMEQADRAMVWLKQAVAAGYTDAHQMKDDKDLDALRDREDFKTLLATVPPGVKQKND